MSKDINQIILDASHLSAKTFLQADTRSWRQIYRIKNDEALFEQRLQSLFWKNISMIHETVPDCLHYHYEKDDQGRDQMVCFFMLVPNDVSMSWWQKIRYGLLLLPFEIGWTPLVRLLAASDYSDEKILSQLNGRKGLQLNRMVVHPSFQGKGIGSKVLGKALQEVADKRQLPVVLSTETPQNVTFYTRL